MNFQIFLILFYYNQHHLKEVQLILKMLLRCLKNKHKNLISISEPVNHPSEMISFSKNKYSFLIKKKNK